MKTITTIFLLLLWITPASAQLVPYWIPDDGCEIVRMGPDSHPLYIKAHASLTLAETADHFYYSYNRHGWDDEDNLTLVREDYPGMDGSTFVYNPPLKVLDLPLTTDKTWTSQSVRSRVGGGTVPKTHILTSTVVGPRTIDTVIGSLEVIEVVEEIVIVGISTRTTTRYLHLQYGDVHELIATDGCAALAAEDLSWSSLKSLYR